MKKTAVVFIHDSDVGAGTVPTILESHGFRVETRLTPEQDFADVNPDLLVVMGGPQGAYEAVRHPYLHKEMDIIAKRLMGSKPTLGFCLGAQLMAGALGAPVYKGWQGPEVGWLDLNVNDIGKEYPLRHLDSKYTKVMQWHGDTFDLPQGATLLAFSELYKNQAFSYGTNGLAIQAHPEVDGQLAAQWIARMDERDIKNMSGSLEDEKKRLLEETKHYSGKLVMQMRLFMGEWLAQIGLI